MLKAKSSKASVDYSKGMPKRHCGICQHFIKPDKCEVVVGKVQSDMWCSKFKKK